MLASSLVPILSFALLSYSQVTRQLERDADARLAQDAKQLGMAVFERLLLLEATLVAHAPASGGALPEALAKGRFRSVGLRDAGALDAGDEAHLAAGGTLLRVEHGPLQITLLRQSGPGRWLVAEVEQSQQHRRRLGRCHLQAGCGRHAHARARPSRRHGAALHAVGFLNGEPAMNVLQPGDCHAFEAGGSRFLYLAPSAAVIAIDDVSAAVLDAVAVRPRSQPDLVADLADRYPEQDLEESVGELVRVRALNRVHAPVRRVPKVLPLTPVPLSTMVLNVTNQCNLSCTYCYEYGEDKIV